MAVRERAAQSPDLAAPRADRQFDGRVFPRKGCLPRNGMWQTRLKTTAKDRKERRRAVKTGGTQLQSRAARNHNAGLTYQAGNAEALGSMQRVKRIRPAAGATETSGGGVCRWADLPD